MYKYIEVKNSDETWEIFKIAADADFNISLIIYYTNTILIGGLWPYQQSIEKYMKSYILKTTSKKKKTHNLIDLLEEVKRINNNFNNKYDEFIRELNSIDVNSRYTGHYSMKIFPFIDMFLDFCEDMRILISNNKECSVFANKRGKEIIEEMMLTRGRCVYNF